MFMEKIRKAIDISTEDLPYLQLLASKKGKHLKNMLEDLIHQVAEAAKREEFKERIQEYQNIK